MLESAKPLRPAARGGRLALWIVRQDASRIAASRRRSPVASLQPIRHRKSCLLCKDVARVSEARRTAREWEALRGLLVYYLRKLSHGATQF